MGDLPQPKRRKGALAGLKGWSQASQVLDRTQAVPTPFPQFDRATGVGGLPLGRITTVYGPTHGGKTVFGIGALKGFLEAGHAAAYIDAEHATPEEFGRELLEDLIDHEDLVACRPESYEEVIDQVDAFLSHIAEARKKAPALCSVVVVDSINKLTPKGELKAVAKAVGMELSRGHHGRDRARLNQAWLDHLVPRLGRAACSMVVIAQERGDGSDARGFPTDGDPKGGQCLQFDASLLVRVSKVSPVKVGDQVTGFKYRARIKKNKVGHMAGRHTDSHFHLRNASGKLKPGLDTGRDLVLMAVDLGILDQKGGWLRLGTRKWNGVERAVAELSQDAEALAALDHAVRTGEVES